MTSSCFPILANVGPSSTRDLDNGSEQSTTGVVKIRYTDEQTVADRSINAAVNAEKVLVLISGIIVSRTASWSVAALRSFSQRHIRLCQG